MGLEMLVTVVKDSPRSESALLQPTARNNGIAAMRTFPWISHSFPWLVLALAMSSSQAWAGGPPAFSPHAKFQPVGLKDARWTDGFWAERFELCHKVVLPKMKEALLDPANGASLINFRIGAGAEPGKHMGTNWSDGDCYKWLEALARVYAVTADPALDQEMDYWIDLIGRTQDPDGYICTQIQLDPTKKRWERRHNHELYNMGHLMTAASVHYQVTGKRNFLGIAQRLANYLYGVFAPRPKELAHFGWNPSNIMGLVDLYRVTGEPRYLELAGIFVDMRGSVPYPRGFVADPKLWDPHPGDQTQDRVPLRKESYAVGHAVTGPYLYCGAADIVAETGERALFEALTRIWHDVVYRKMSINGGIGAHHHTVSIRGDQVHEAFGLPYELPNRNAYNETCANIANAMWNWRMLRLTGEGRFADVMELVLYNSMLSGMSLDGTRFCYANPLARLEGVERGTHDTPERWRVFQCYCCPPNVARTIAATPVLAYGISADTVWIHLYGSSILQTEFPQGGTLRLRQQTNYPWEGSVKITLEQVPESLKSVKLRIPGWASKCEVKVNGIVANDQLHPGSYCDLRRSWTSGDVIDLELPLEVKLMEANPLMESARGQVAVMRGPVLYCLESCDLEPGVDIRNVALRRGSRWEVRFDPAELGGATILETEGLLWPGKPWDTLYRPMVEGSPRSIKIRMIPYYAWNNRTTGEMLVWIPID